MTLKKTELPSQVKVLPILGQKMWLRVYNRVIRTQNETVASKTSWQVIRQFYKRKGTKWVKRK